MKTIQAINDHVVAKEIIKKDEMTDGGILIPQTVKVEPQKYGEVLSIGEKVKNIKDWGESYLAREKISKEIPYTLTATEEGYEFDFNFDDERKKIQVEIVDGNKPILKGELVGDLWRHGVNYQIHEKHGDNIQNRGECNLLRIITRKFDYWHPKIKNGETCSGDLGRHKLLTHESLSFAEAKTYAGLNSWIHPDVMDVQLKRAREHIDKKIDELVVEVGEEQVD